MRSLVRGDIDGFFGLALDNLVQLLLIVELCRSVLGFPGELVFGRILPGVAVSLLLGNLWYARQALRLAKRENRDDVCALPYGINTVSLIGHVFLVMLPAKLAAEAAGAADPWRVAWIAGLAATVGSGLIELSGSFVAERLRKATPRAALLSTLAGIALTFIALGFLFRTYAHPIVGLVTLGVVMLTYFGRVKFKGGIPGGLVAVVLGTLLAWMTGIVPESSGESAGLSLPVPVLGELWEGLSGGMLITYLSVIIPMGLFNLVGSLQNIESAEAAGDSYETRPSLAVNGIGTLAAAAFGSCFPTTLYIGHPGWKAMGARAGYSTLNGLFMTVICLTGLVASIVAVVPVDAGMAIVLWIGIVITAQAFSATPDRHAPAVVVGLMPGVAAWGAIMIKTALRTGGVPFEDGLVGDFAAGDLWVNGAFALEQGFIFTSMVLAAVTVCVIERKWRVGAGWCVAAAVLSCAGLVHSWTWAGMDTVMHVVWTWPWENAWALGYLGVGALLWVAPVVTEG